MMNGFGFFGLLGSSMMLAVMVVVVLGGIWLYRRLATPRRSIDTPHDTGTLAGDQALTRLRERYAAGDIDDEEYERRLSALTHWH